MTTRSWKSTFDADDGQAASNAIAAKAEARLRRRNAA